MIITLVAGIDQVYAPPAERIALNRPMLTTLSVTSAFVPSLSLQYFSFVYVPLAEKSLTTVALGYLEKNNQTVWYHPKNLRYGK